jgi:hypothetical protein
LLGARLLSIVEPLAATVTPIAEAQQKRAKRNNP